MKRIVLAGLLVAVLLSIPLSAGPATASDSVSVFEYDPSTVEAAPGETVTVEVSLWSETKYDDVGVESVTVTVLFDADALTLADVERGEWMDQGEDTDVETDVSREEGAATVEQTRSPAAGGAEGMATFVELTLTVDEDAPPGNYSLDFDDAEVMLTNDYYQPVFTHEGEVVVEEGGAASGPDGRTDPDGSTDAGDGTDPGGDADFAVTGTGFGPAVAFGALVATALAAVAVGRRYR